MEFLGLLIALFCCVFGLLLTFLTGFTYVLILIRERKSGNRLSAIIAFTKQICIQTLILIANLIGDIMVFLAATFVFVIYMALAGASLAALIMNYNNLSITHLDLAAMYFHTVSIISMSIYMMWASKSIFSHSTFSFEKELKRWFDVYAIEANLYELPKRKSHLPFDRLLYDEWKDEFEPQNEQHLKTLADELDLPYEMILSLSRHYSKLEKHLATEARIKL